MLLPAVGGGNGVSQGGGHPHGHAALLVQHPTAPCPAPPHSPLCRGTARELWVPLKTSPSARSFCKSHKQQNGGAGEVLVASLRCLPKPFPRAFQQGCILTRNGERGAPRDAWHSQPSWDHEELRQGCQGDAAAAASTGDLQHPRAAAPAAPIPSEEAVPGSIPGCKPAGEMLTWPQRRCLAGHEPPPAPSSVGGQQGAGAGSRYGDAARLGAGGRPLPATPRCPPPRCPAPYLQQPLGAVLQDPLEVPQALGSPVAGVRGAGRRVPLQQRVGRDSRGKRARRRVGLGQHEGVAAVAVLHPVVTPAATPLQRPGLGSGRAQRRRGAGQGHEAKAEHPHGTGVPTVPGRQ